MMGTAHFHADIARGNERAVFAGLALHARRSADERRKWSVPIRIPDEVNASRRPPLIILAEMCTSLDLYA